MRLRLELRGLILVGLAACGSKKDGGGGEKSAPTPGAPVALPPGVTVKPWTAVPDPPDGDTDAPMKRVDCEAVMTTALLTKHFAALEHMSGGDSHDPEYGTSCDDLGRVLGNGKRESIRIRIQCGAGTAIYDREVGFANASATATDPGDREAFGTYVSATGLGRGALANETALHILDDDTDCTIWLENLVDANPVGKEALVTRLAAPALDIVRNLTPATIGATDAWSMVSAPGLAVDCAPVLAAIGLALPGSTPEDAGKSGDWGTNCPTTKSDAGRLETVIMCFTVPRKGLRQADTWPGRADHVPDLGALAKASTVGLLVADDDTNCAVDLRLKVKGDPVDGRKLLAEHRDLVTGVLAAITPELARGK